MSYQIYDNGASLRIVSDSGEKLVMKHQIVQLSLVSGSVIKIDQGDPLTTLYLNYADITLPVAVSATALRDLLNAYITNCVCNSCSGSGLVQNYTADASVGESFTGNTIYTNMGAINPITFTLTSTSIGSSFTFYVAQDIPFHIQTKSATGTIRVANNQTSGGYPLTSNQSGSSVTLCLVAPDQWVAVAVVGTWLAETLPA